MVLPDASGTQAESASPSDATETPQSTMAATVAHQPAPPTAAFDDDGTEVPAIKLVQPRNLAPEYARRVTAAWQATKSPFQNPRETLNSSSGKTGDPDNLLIGTRSLGSVEEKDKRADYELSEVIGEGNMGTVWSARQSSLDREVAIKLPKRVAGGSTLGREQFISEVVVTGQLDHPNIVPIYDMGRDEAGQLFYAMKRVEGRPWDECMHEEGRTRQENVEILMKVCDAIRFAHDRGVIHRDIKPQNVMVGKYGEVSVMDWGIALRLPAQGKSSSVIKLSPAGTPAYMAPEMATANAADIGPHTDVYLLGAVLYEIITREPPHPPPADSHDRLVQQNACLLMAARNVITPSTETGELIDIAYKAMATDISKRYQTVDEFQDAVREYFSHAESIALADRGQSHLANALESRNGVYEDYAKARFAFGEALQLWPENSRARNGLAEATIAYADRAYKDGNYGLGISLLDPANDEHTDLLKRLKSAKRRADRNRFVAFASAVAAACFLIGGIAVSSFFAIRESRAKNAAILAKEAETKAKDDALAAEGRERTAKEAESVAKDAAIKAQLDTEEARKNEEAQKKIAQKAAEDAIAAQAAETVQRQRAEHASYNSEIGLAAKHIQRNAFTAAQSILKNQEKNAAQAGLRGWEWGHLAYLTREPSIQPFELNTLARVESVAYSPDQTWVAAGTDKGDLYVWRAAERDNQPTVLAHAAPVSAVRISDDGRLLASVAGNQVHLWQLPAGDGDGDGRIAPAGTLQYTAAQKGNEKAMLLSVDIEPNGGDKILTSSTDSKAQIWSRSDPNKAPIILRDNVSGPVWQARFSHQGDRIVTAGNDQTVRIYDAGGGSERQLDGHRGPVYAAEFSPDGKYVVSGGRDRRLLVWDLQSSAAAQDPREVIQARLTPVAEESVEIATQFQQLGEHAAAIRALSFSKDGNILYSASDDNTVRIWNLSQGVANLSPVSTLRGHGGWVRSCAAGNDDKHVLSGSYDGKVFLWNWREYAFPRVLRAASESAISDIRYTSTAASPDAKWIATAAENGEVTVWDMQDLQNPVPHTLREGHDWQATTAAFFNDGSRLLTAGGDNAAVVWDARLGNQLFRLGGWNTPGGTGWRGVGAVSHDGHIIVTGSDDGDDDDPLKTKNPHAVLAKLWDAESGRPIARLRIPNRNTKLRPEATAIAFSPNDGTLFIGDQNGRCYVFTMNEKYPYWVFKGHSAKVSAARYLSNGRLLTASSDGTVIKWNVDEPSARPPRELTLTHRDRVVAMDVSRDERLLITAADTKHDDTALRVWNLAEGGAENAAELYKLPKTAFGSTEVRSVAMHPTQPHALVTVFDKSKSAYQVGRWDWGSGDQVRTVLTGLRDTSTAFYAPGNDNAILTVGGRGARMRLANQVTNQGQMSYRPQGRVQSIAFSPDSHLLASAGDDGSIKLWRFDDASGEWLAERKLVGQHQGEVRSVAFHPTSSTMLLSASADGSAKLWERGAEDWKVIQTFGNAQTDAVNQAIFSAPDANGAVEVLTASDDGKVRIWNTGGNLVRELPHSGPVLCVAMSPDRAWIVSGAGTTAYIWSVNNPKTEADETLTAHSADITSLAFSLDGLRLITAGRDHNVKLWDTTPWGVVADDADESYRGELLTLEGHNDAVTSICIFKNATYPSIVTAGADGQAILWPSIDFRAAPAQAIGRR
jgi:WD40 repeat protein/serine/threonine protein kinase